MATTGEMRDSMSGYDDARPGDDVEGVPALAPIR
jgi:hypothetical protein